MNTLDAFVAGGQALTVNHTAVDYCINTGLLYGPGVALTAAAVASWRTGRWVLNRIHHRIEEQARRDYTARAARLHQVADRADAFLAMPEDLVTARLEAHYSATPDHAQEEGR
ncbi:hypothetical protein [Streptomyces sp. NBC_00338]|uniref:hypothetical protein n=1 Tax=Streptomyces sp. NBC_00338 TaxID=2975715 RepID=UPI0022578438|nr:hypothetical protein [Streptomyces sp. NBC_00338]MCX5138361.1 hypothetical protein [Streptomyces sp. NBC_00338]MCX5145150.1 hypothetical protein [Streptomyces sp. NBC_00338]